MEKQEDTSRALATTGAAALNDLAQATPRVITDPEVDSAVRAVLGAGQVKVMPILLELGRLGLLSEVKMLADVVELLSTPHIGENALRLSAIEKASEQIPYAWWLERAGRTNSRQAILDWWTVFTQIVAVEESHAGNNRATVDGIDDNVQGATNLWPASVDLARQMEDESRRYGGLRAADINNPNSVVRVLMADVVPEALQWLEILVGQDAGALEQHCSSLLRALHTVEAASGEFEPLQGALLTISLSPYAE